MITSHAYILTAFILLTMACATCRFCQVIYITFYDQHWCFVNQYICWLVFSFHYVSAFVYRYATLMLDQTQQALYIEFID
jgi:hypothetical protein